MVNSSALSELLARFESAGAFHPDPSQPANTSMIADAAASAANHRQRSARTFMEVSSWQVPRSFRFLQLLERRHISGQRLAIGQFHSPVAALGVQKIQEACSAALVSILTDVARVLRLFEVAGGVKLHHFFVAPDRLIGIGNVGKNRIAGRLLLLLCLRERMSGTRDLSLVAVEDRQLKVSEDGSRVLAGNVVEIISTVYIDLGVRFGQENLALCGGDPQFSGTEVGPLAQRPRLQVFQVPFERLIRQIAHHVEVGRYRVVAQEPTQADERLFSREAGRRDVGLKLQKLELDLQIIAFTNVPRLELRLADIDRLLKAFQILERKLERRFRQQNADELLAYIKRQRALCVGNLGARDGRLITGGLQTALTLVTAFEKVRDPNIELLSFVQILPGKILRTKKWNELRIQPQSRIGSQVRSDLLGLILENQGSRGLERMVVRQRQINGLIKGDPRRILPTTCPHQQEKHRRRGEHPRVPGAHKV